MHVWKSAWKISSGQYYECKDHNKLTKKSEILEILKLNISKASLNVPKLENSRYYSW
jgi:hypothetical protein